MSFAAAQYRAATVETASPVQIVVRLYDAAIRFLTQAEQAGKENKPNERNAKLRRAHAIVTELQASLVHTHAPELCSDLDRLYEYVLHTITQSTLSNGTEQVASAIKVMRELRAAWAELAKRNV
ncbi:MAG: flagellar export chaperone FliS [Myxococcales bacterium]|nr:flagellar export chaperone FliS [Myxococcales bacterium]MDD9970234.1 flagellar export chaperone FliS [Myxococcales bacterium]